MAKRCNTRDAYFHFRAHHARATVNVKDWLNWIINNSTQEKGGAHTCVCICARTQRKKQNRRRRMEMEMSQHMDALIHNACAPGSPCYQFAMVYLENRDNNFLLFCDYFFKWVNFGRLMGFWQSNLIPTFPLLGQEKRSLNGGGGGGGGQPAWNKQSERN